VIHGLTRLARPLRVADAALAEAGDVLCKSVGLVAAEDGVVVGAGALSKDLDVVAMHVHGVMLVAGVLDDEAGSVVCAVVVYVLDLGVAISSFVGAEEDGVVIVDAEGAVGLVPDEVGAVRLELDGEDFGRPPDRR
jgi:hypothetical protein